VALDVDHPRVMKQPVQDGRGDHGVAEQLLPVPEALIRGQDRRALLIPVGNELEEQMRLPAVDRQISDFVNDDQAGSEEGLAPALRLLELTDQRLHGREVDLEPVAAGFDGQGDRQVRFTDSGRAQEDDVLVVGQEGQVEQRHDRLLVQLGMEGEVVFLDRLGEGQPRDLESRLDAALLLGRDFLLQQMIQEREVGGLILLGVGYDGVEHLRRADELQPLQVFLEAFAGQLLHETPPCASFSYSSSER